MRGQPAGRECQCRAEYQTQRRTHEQTATHEDHFRDESRRHTVPVTQRQRDHHGSRPNDAPAQRADPSDNQAEPQTSRQYVTLHRPLTSPCQHDALHGRARAEGVGVDGRCLTPAVDTNGGEQRRSQPHSCGPAIEVDGELFKVPTHGDRPDKDEAIDQILCSTRGADRNRWTAPRWLASVIEARPTLLDAASHMTWRSRFATWFGQVRSFPLGDPVTYDHALDHQEVIAARGASWTSLSASF